MSTRKQIEKVKFMITEIINNYFLADQKLALLAPLLNDNELVGAWDNSAGVRALEAMRMTIYMAILSDMRAILFDNDRRSISMPNVVRALENDNFTQNLKKQNCIPLPVNVAGHDNDPGLKATIEKHIQEKDVAEAEDRFDRLLPLVIDSFNSLKNSELGKRVDGARSKMISHKEINNTDGERALYNPTDFGLKWDDPKEIVEQSKEMIFSCCLLINKSSYDLKSFLGGHLEAADSFWEKVKKNA